MTQQDDITQRVLTDDEIRGEIHNAIGFGFEPGELQSVNAADLMNVAYALLSKLRAPVSSIREGFELTYAADADDPACAADLSHFTNGWRACLMSQARAPVADERAALDLLDTLFTAYENGTPCYEEPDSQGGYLGMAFRIDDDTFRACADLLNKERPRTAGALASAPAAITELRIEFTAGGVGYVSIESARAAVLAASRASAPVACNCPGGNKPVDLHAPNCPVRTAKATLVDPYDGGTWLASAPVTEDDEVERIRGRGPAYPYTPNTAPPTPLASAPVAGEAPTDADLDKLYRETVTEGPDNDTRCWENPHRLYARAVLSRYAAPQASAEALEVARAALMEIADLADVEADQRGVIVNQALTKIAKMTVAPQASAEVQPNAEIVALAREGVRVNKPGTPEYQICAELRRLARALKQPQAEQGDAREA